MKKLCKSVPFWIVVVLVLVAVIIASQRVRQVNENTVEAVERPPLPVEVIGARRGTVQAHVPGEGMARAVRREFLNFESSGKVVLIGKDADGGELREGSKVYGPQPGEQFGQVLAQLDQREIRAAISMEKAALEQARQNVTVAHATVNQAETEYELAKADFERFTKHSEAGTTLSLYEQQLAQTNENVLAAEARVAQAESDYKLAQAELERTRKLSQSGATVRTFEEALNQARQNLSSAKAAVTQAENSYKLAKENFEKTKNLYEEGIIAKTRYDEAETRYLNAQEAINTAKANLQAAQSQVKSAENELEKAKINVPVTEVATAEARLQSAEAALKTARANLETAKSQRETAATKLEQAKIDVPVVEYEAAKAKYLNAEASLRTAAANLQVAQAQVDASLARLQQAELNLERTSIFAPFDGMITYLNIKVGDYVTPQTMNTSTEQAMMQTAPIVLIDPSEFEITLNLPAFLGRTVEPGQPAQIIPSIASFPEEVAMMEQQGDVPDTPDQSLLMEHFPMATGKVYSVSPSISPGGRYIQTKIRAFEGIEYMQDGMFVTARIVVAEKTDVITLPTNAMTFRKDKAYAFIVDPGTNTVSKRHIILGISDTSNYEILEGLQEGELVVSEGRHRLVEGTKVEILNQSHQSAQSAFY